MNDQAFALRDRMAIKTKEDLSKRNMRVLTVTSGKGGVGKSNFTTNLALCMKQQGHTSLILDADFGLANIEIIFGERPQYNLAHYIKGHCSMEQLICHSQYGIPFISGGSGVKEMLFLNQGQVGHIAEGLKSIESVAETLIIDTGAGINEIVLKFSQLADEVLVVVTPEPASITDAYALIKTLEKELVHTPRFKIIINKADSIKEAQEVFSKLNYVTKQFLKIDLAYGGFIPYDEKLFQAVKLQKPVVVYDHRAQSSKAYEQISRSLLGQEQANPMKGSWVEKFKSVFSPK
ncbi:MAG: MinD/ParA family protein [Cellulosilyticaceae bacterium]